jgi:hypothetical protein
LVREGKPINSGYHMANSTMSTVMGQLALFRQADNWDDVVKSEFHGPSPDEASFDTPPPVRRTRPAITRCSCPASGKSLSRTELFRSGSA